MLRRRVGRHPVPGGVSLDRFRPCVHPGPPNWLLRPPAGRTPTVLYRAVSTLEGFGDSRRMCLEERGALRPPRTSQRLSAAHQGGAPGFPRRCGLGYGPQGAPALVRHCPGGRARLVGVWGRQMRGATTSAVVSDTGSYTCPALSSGANTLRCVGLVPGSA